MANSPAIFPEAPRFFRTWEFAGTVTDTDFLEPESSGVDMSGCPDKTPPCRLLILNTQATPQDLVLTGEDGVNFVLKCEPQVIDVAGTPTGVGKVTVFEGGVIAIEATGSEAIESVTACWWSGNRMPRRTTNP